MKAYDEYYRENLRLTLLRLIEEAPGETVNSAVVRSGLEAFAFNISGNVFRSELNKLVELGAIKSTDNNINPKLKILTLTEAGRDHIRGLSVIDGIALP